MKSWYSDVICLSIRKWKIYGKLPGNILSRSILRMNWNTMENKIMHVKIAVAMWNIIYHSAQPRPQKNELHNLHPLVSLLLQFRVCLAWFRATWVFFYIFLFFILYRNDALLTYSWDLKSAKFTDKSLLRNGIDFRSIAEKLPKI